MNILVVGAGPAGVYFAYLAKRRHPEWHIRVVEQNPADAVFGALPTVGREAESGPHPQEAAHRFISRVARQGVISR